MKKISMFAAVAALVAVGYSCTQEAAKIEIEDTPQEEVRNPAGHEAVIGLSLDEGTKTTHTEDVVSGKTNLKTLWKDDDKILVTFTKAAVEYREVFSLVSGAGEADGTFKKDDSVLEAGDSYTVTYYSSNDYDAGTFSWAEQNGSPADIPEYLTSVAAAVYPAAPALKSELVHFHFNLNKGEDPGDEGLTLANAYFSNATAPFVVDTDGNTGEIKVTPTAAFVYDNKGESSNADFYVSVKLAGDSYGNTMKLDLMNGDHYAGIQGYALSWDITKTYTTDKVYKLTSVNSGTEKVLAYQNGLVGATGNTSGFYAEHSENIEIPVGKRLEIQYVNYNKGAGDGWLNADLVLSKVKDNYVDNDANRYFFLRNDGWGSGDNTYLFKDRNGYPDKYFANLMSDLNGAVVNVTIDHGNAGYVAIASEAISTANDKLHQYYSHAVSAVDPVYAFYTTDQSHLVMKQAVLTDIPVNENITGLAPAATTVYYNGNTDKMNLSPFGVKVEANTSGGSYLVTNMYGASASGLVSVSATNTVIYYSGVTAASSPVNVVQNNVIPSATVLGGTEIGWQDNVNHMFTVAPGTSQVVGATLASKKQENWHCPTISVRKSDNAWLANFRLDNWGTGATYKDDDSDEKVKVLRSSNWNWENFKDNMDGAIIYMTVSNNGNGKASVRFDLRKGSDAFYQYFDDISIPANEDIQFCISTEYCSLTFM